MMWRHDDITFEVLVDQSDHPIVVIKFMTPAGELFVMASVEERGQILFLDGLHIHGAARNQVGIVNLRVLGDVIMEELEYDELVIQGAPRTTGARPGHIPRPIRFRRGRSPSSGRGP